MTERTISRRNFLKKSATSAALLSMGSLPALSFSRAHYNLFSKDSGEKYAPLNYNENPLGPSPLALEVLKKGDLPYNRYVKSEELKKEIAAFHGMQTENILLSVGATEILKITPLAFAFNKGDVVTALQTYKTLIRYSGKFGIKVKVKHLTPGYNYDLTAIKDAIDENTTLVYICNPNNPTGTVIPFKELSNFIDKLPSTIVTLVDEAYHHYIEDKNYPSATDLIKKGKNVIVARTFSKVYGIAGLRMGYAIAPADLIKQMSTYSAGSLGLNIAGISAAKASLRDVDHINKSVNLAKEGRDFFYKSFENMGLTYIRSQTPFVAVNVKRDSSQVVDVLKKHKVYVRRGRDWQMPSFIRISMGFREENELCIKALKKVLA